MKIKIEIRDRKDFPACVQSFEVLRGICVGGCIDPSGTIDHCGAHAHVDTGIYSGWICLSFKYQLREKQVLLHEVAHLLVPYTGHSKIWRNKVKEIGGTIKPMLSVNKKRGAPAFYPGYKKGGKYYYPSDKWVLKHFRHKFSKKLWPSITNPG